MAPRGPRLSRRDSDARRALEADLRRDVAGQVRFDRMTRILYATDASNYQIEPFGVVCPRDADDVAAGVSVCAAHRTPVIARAGGSGLAGQAIGRGVVLDVSVHLTDLAIDAERRVARVGAGVVLDRLNRAAGVHGLGFGPDPASGERACMGGVIGTNATGAHSLTYGMAADHLHTVDAVLADASRARLERRDRAAVASTIARGGLEGTIYDVLRTIAEEQADVVRRDFPRYARRAGGYNLDRLVAIAAGDRPADRLVGTRAGDGPADQFAATRAGHGPIDAAALFAGSEGTLAVATGFEVGLVRLPTSRALLVAHFDEALDPFRAVPVLLETGATAIELVDRTMVDLARQAQGYADDLALVQGRPAALLVVEYSGASDVEVVAGLDAGTRALAAAGFHGAVVRAVDPAVQERVWRVRKVGLGILLGMRGDWKPVAGVEDTGVPPEALADYMADVQRLMGELGVRAGYYGHASSGCIHIRPILDLKTAHGVETLATLAEEMFTLVLRHGGVNSSEHGDGLARGQFNRRHFGDAVYGLFGRVKSAFDPPGILNPGKIVGCPPLTDNLRYGPGYPAIELPARFSYPLDGDIARAIEQCNGAGVCRKVDVGTMCPSYRVTLDERDTTRARANALRAILDGRLPSDAIASDELAEVFDLCVGCKACRVECPSGVDMARLKIEVLAARHDARGTPLAARVFGHIHDIDRLASPLAPLVNAVMGGPMWSVGARLLGVAPARRFPALAGESFDRWWARRGPSRPGGLGSRAVDRRDPVGLDPSGRMDARGRDRHAAGAGAGTAPGNDGAIGMPPAVRTPVVLFADTFATFNEPSIGRAAVAVLEAAGYEVIVPRRWCCGRPALSLGLVDVAVRGMRANLAVLAPLARAGLAIVVPEPSCASAFRDEMPDLLTRDGEHEDAVAVAAAVRTLDEFVAALPPGVPTFRPGPTEAVLHVHCHQRAHAGTGPSLAALGRIPGLEVVEPDAACCGMAGAFGFMAKHHSVSLAMAERRLAPAVRAAPDDAVIVAPGPSCRQQIADTTGRRAVHPIELLAAQLAEVAPPRRE